MAKVVHGARVVVRVADRVVGIFSDVTYRYGLEAMPAYILGKFQPDVIDYTGQEPVQLTCTGWRAINVGPHAGILKGAAAPAAGAAPAGGATTTQLGGPMVPKVNDLLLGDYISSIEIMDRQTGKTVFKVTNVRSLGYNGGHSTRQLSQNTYSYIGIDASDEEGQSTEQTAAGVGIPTIGG